MKFQKFTILCSLLLVLISLTVKAQTPVIGLQNAAVDCSGPTPTLCMNFVLSTNVDFGCSSWVIDLSYNSAALTTSDPQVTINPAFNDGTNYSTAINVATPGRVLLSNVLNPPTAPFDITAAPVLLATVCFAITDQAAAPNFSITNIETYVSDEAFATLLDASSAVNPTFPTSLACPGNACTGVTIVANATAGATTCGNSNGTITTSPSGGAAPYTTAISGSGVSGSLASGTYSITVTDNNGCTGTQGGISVAASTGITVSATSTANSSCATPNGTASATVSSGNAGATFAWSNGATDASLTGLAAGTYSVTATKAGCTATGSTTVASTASAPTLNLVSTTPNTCGAGNGGATVSASGGTGTITFAWSNGATAASITAVSGGSYSVTATDANSCTASIPVTIANQPAPAATAAATNTSCGLNNGAIDVSVAGGTGTLTYAWSDGGVTTQDRSSLAAGSYTVTVTDGNGCTANASATIAASTANSVSIMSTATSCGLNNGSAMAMPTGTGPFTYNWSNGATTQNAANLAAGNYNVTATAGGCTATATTNIATSTGVTASATATQTSCTSATGSVTVNASGTSTLSYSWTPNVSSTASASDLSAGTYNIVVTDDNGCTAATSANVTTAGGPSSVSTTTSNATCGNANGVVAVASVSGGVAPYSHSLDGGPGQELGNFTSVAVGPHVLTTTDANGCTLNTNVTVSNTAGPSAVVVSTTPGACGTSTGSVSANITGGTGPFQFSWTLNGSLIAGNAIINSQEEGTYAVTVTDNNACTAAGSSNLVCTTGNVCDPSNSPGICQLSLVDLGGGGATLVAVPAGDAVGINYTSPGIANNVGYIAGFYVCTDAACADIVAFYPSTTSQIENPTAPLLPNTEYFVMTVVVLAANPFDTDAQCHQFGGLADQSFLFEQGDICETTNIVVTAQPYSCATGLQVSASGGVGPYQFNPPVGAPLVNGTTNITAVDANGCVGVGTIVVTNATINAIADYDCTDGLEVTITQGPDGATYTFSTDNGTTGLANGSYQLTITASNGCSTVIPFGVECIADPCTGVTVSGTASYDCNGGGLTVSGSGGTAPYTYSVANGSQLNNGNYTINITDANGCSGQASLVVSCAGDPCAGVNVTGSAVYDCNGGGLTISGSGGTAPYTYSIANGSQLNNGNYTIDIFDANGCSGQTTVTVNCSTGCTNPPNAATTAYTGGALCNAANEGMTTVNLNSLVTGDAGGTWSGNGGAASGTFNAAGLAPGIYVVVYTVTAPGCPNAISTQSLTVTDCNPAPIANPDVSFVSTSATGITIDVTNNDTDLPVGCGISLTNVNSITPAGVASLVELNPNGEITLAFNFVPDEDIIVFYTIEDCVGQTAVGQWTINVTDCGANAGVITQPTHPKYCADNNVIFQHFGAAGGAYSLAYAVVNAATDEVAYYGPNVGSLPFAAAVPPISPAGNYLVYGVSYETIGGLPLWPVSGSVCADVSAPINIKVFAPLDTVTAYKCNLDGTVDVKILLFGGAPTFNGNGSYITNFTPSFGPSIWHPVDSLVAHGELDGYTHGDEALAAIGNGAGVLTLLGLPETLFDGGAGFNLDVDSDGALCDDNWYITLNINCPEPPPCDPIPGVMDELNTVYVCAGDLATVANIGAEFQDYDEDGSVDEVIGYVLWDPTDSLSTVQISPDPTFDFVPIPCPSYYLAAAAVGPDGNGDGYVDWDDICTKFTPNVQPVVFLCPIEATWATICDDNTGEYQIVIESVTGGLPQADGSNYSYSGSAGAGEFGSGIILGPYASGTAFTIDIADNNGCILENPITGMEDCKVTAIELLSFTGEVQETGNMLKWITASEIENDYFTLLRSTDGEQFTAIGTIDGAGSSNVANNYHFMDKNALTGLSYYRLDETNFNGETTTAGDVITLTRGEVRFGVVSASPVPAFNSVEVAFTTATSGNIVMNIYDVAGKLVNTDNLNTINGLNTVTIDISNYAAGVYFVQLNDGMQLITTRIAKEQ